MTEQKNEERRFCFYPVSYEKCHFCHVTKFRLNQCYTRQGKRRFACPTCMKRHNRQIANQYRAFKDAYFNTALSAVMPLEIFYVLQAKVLRSFLFPPGEYGSYR